MRQKHQRAKEKGDLSGCFKKQLLSWELVTDSVVQVTNSLFKW